MSAWASEPLGFPGSLRGFDFNGLENCLGRGGVALCVFVHRLGIDRRRLLFRGWSHAEGLNRGSRFLRDDSPVEICDFGFFGICPGLPALLKKVE